MAKLVLAIFIFSVLCGSLRFFVVLCGSLRFFAVLCGSLHVYLIATEGSLLVQ